MVNGTPQFHLLEVGLTVPPESFLRLKFEGLARRGVRITISASRSERFERLNIAGVDVIPAPRWDESFLKHLGALVFWALRVGLRKPRVLRATIGAARKPIRDEKGSNLLAFLLRLRSYLPLALVQPDVAHFEWNMAAIHYLPMAEVWSCPTVVSCHGSDTNVRPHAPEAADYVRWLRMSFDRVSAVHCTSEATAVEATKVGMDPRRAWLIRPAVDPEVFCPAARTAADRRVPSSPRPLRVVSVGDFRWLKAHEDSVRAVALLAHRGVPIRLEIIGGKPDRIVSEASVLGRIEDAIARNGLRDRIKLLGELSPAEVCDHLRAADVLLHTSLSEGLPNAVLEAIACGLPVVVTDCGGVAEAVRDGIEGFLVPVRGVTDAADALHTLYENEELRLRMGRAGRERVKSAFSLQAQIDDFLTMYEALREGLTRTGLPPAVAGVPQLRLLSVGPMSWTQGFDDALQAVHDVRERGIDCHLRIFGEGPYVDAVWFARHQLGLERHVELRYKEDLSRLGTRPWLRATEGATQLLACPEWRRQLEWADALLDCSLSDPPLAALAAARAAGVEVVRASGDPQAVLEALFATVAGRGARHDRVVGSVPTA